MPARRGVRRPSWPVAQKEPSSSPRPNRRRPAKLSGEHASDQQRCSLLPHPPPRGPAWEVSIQVAAAVHHRAHEQDHKRWSWVSDANAGAPVLSAEKGRPLRRPEDSVPEVSQFDRRPRYRRRRPAFGRRARFRRLTGTVTSDLGVQRASQRSGESDPIYIRCVRAGELCAAATPTLAPSAPHSVASPIATLSLDHVSAVARRSSRTFPSIATIRLGAQRPGPDDGQDLDGRESR